jgi:hypothetical protein
MIVLSEVIPNGISFEQMGKTSSSHSVSKNYSKNAPAFFLQNAGAKYKSKLVILC